MARLRLFLVSGLVGCLMALPAAARAQTGDAPAGETPPAHVSYVDGRVLLEYDAATEEIEANTPLVPGDRVRTEAGRAEIVFGDGSILHLDDYTTLDLLSDRLVRLLAGRVIATVGTGLAGQLQIDAPSGSVRPVSAGEYRIALLPRGAGSDLELAVVRGRAELFTDTEVVALAAGQRAVADGAGAFAGPWPFNSADLDAFARWSATRLDARRGATSYAYLSGETRHYAGDFDRYGTWGHEPVYGYVWYPRVAHGWRPYYHGRWKHYPRWGWTWVGGPRWAWPTHHYGRWGVSSAGAWFWIPGRQWSGAWVHWGIASKYVSWCPLGFDNRPVFGFWRKGFRHAHSPWRGWTVVHRSHFGARRGVHAVALDGQRVVSTQQPTFVTQAVAPAFAGARHGRLSAAGGTRAVAVPRGSTGFAGRVHPTRPQRSGRTAAIQAGAAGRSRSGGEIRTSDGRRFVMPAAAPAAAGRRSGSIGQAVPRESGAAVRGSGTASDAPPSTPDVGVFRRRSGRAVESGTTNPWRAEDVPVYRGGRLGGTETAAPRARTRSGTSPSPAPVTEAPPADAGRDGVAPDRGSRGGGSFAVPRGRSREASAPPPSSPRGSSAPARGGSVRAPSGRGAASPSGPAPSVGSGGGRARTAPAGSSRGTAVSRGSGGSSGDSSGGGSRGGSSRGGGGRRR